MWTTYVEYYIRKAIFNEGDWYVLPEEPDKNYKANLFHSCSEKHDWTDMAVGRVFNTLPQDMECIHCHQSPGDGILTVYTFLREA